MRRILNAIELNNTRHKLSRLEQMYEAHEHEIGGDEELREMSMASLKKLINQLKEEVAWTETHLPVREA